MNGAAILLDGQDPQARALVCVGGDGGRTEYTFAEVSQLSAAMAGALASAGVGAGDVVMTVIGSRAEWVITMVAALHLGAVVLPCLEQLRPADLVARIQATRPKAVVVTDASHDALEQARAMMGRERPDADPGPVPRGAGRPSRERTAQPAAGIRTVPVDLRRLGADAALASTPPRAELTALDPALITFTSGTSGPAKAVVHGLKYIAGQRLQAEHWFGARPGELAWCTAAPGWSKSARNVFMAPWLCGAAALLHDARFDPATRLEVLRAERPAVLCMAPTEYRLLAKRTDLALPESLRRLVAAGEALDPAVLHAWHHASGLWVRDGFGQTETGQLTAPPGDETPLPGSMGRPLPGMALELRTPDEDGVGELVIADPSTVPTFFLGYLDVDRGVPVGHDGPWHTGDRVRRDDDGNLFFVGRTDDVIASSGYRIGPFEVESVLVEHPAVAEAAAVAAPDPERGSVVRAVVVLRAGFEPSPQLVGELQAHVRERTAPYKYPRIIDFVDSLPKTASGKVRRAVLRDGDRPGA